MSLPSLQVDVDILLAEHVFPPLYVVAFVVGVEMHARLVLALAGRDLVHLQCKESMGGVARGVVRGVACGVV